MPSFNDPVSSLSGVGIKRAALLSRLEIKTIYDLLYYFPKRYEDRSALRHIQDAASGESACIRAVAAHDARTSLIRRGLTLSKIRVFDDTGALTVVFFNQKFAASTLLQGKEYIFFGRVEGGGDRKSMQNPVFEEAGGSRFLTGRIVPVYSLIAGLSGKVLMRCVEASLPYAAAIPESLPHRLLKKHGFLTISDALCAIHFPRTSDDAFAARRRIAYEQWLVLCLRAALLRKKNRVQNGLCLAPVDLTPFFAALPFALTGAQKRTIFEAFADMESTQPMNRLVQGDVGSGKTVVAAACIYLTAKNNCQSMLMAPTEILARQHYSTLCALLSSLGIRVSLLTGSTGKKERQTVLSAFACGDTDLLVGTHAVLEDDVLPHNLALVITDEQHRFGVRQRAKLSMKGTAPHALVLSATPIPRTLSLILFGELDLSVIDELPPGRQQIETFLVGEDKRNRAYAFVRRLVESGRQAYVVCPAIEEAEDSDLKATALHAAHLQSSIFSGLSCGVLHGRLKGKEKNRLMDGFLSGEIQILVSTTVIEVGIDVPNAVIMVIENAERFGLSTLHQLRGRVGRGSEKSFCILMSATSNPNTRARLKLLTRTANGFEIAEEDLKERGPGDFIGARQHGLPMVKTLDISGEMQLVKDAEADAEEILRTDPDLSLSGHAQLKEAVKHLSGTSVVFN